MSRHPTGVLTIFFRPFDGTSEKKTITLEASWAQAVLDISRKETDTSMVNFKYQLQKNINMYYIYTYYGSQVARKTMLKS
jgi:hypothetical protein